MPSTLYVDWLLESSHFIIFYIVDIVIYAHLNECHLDQSNQELHCVKYMSGNTKYF